MPEVTELMVSAALVAEANYRAERDEARRKASQEFGHAGAHIPREEPDPEERVARMLRAALGDLAVPTTAAAQAARDHGRFKWEHWADASGRVVVGLLDIIGEQDRPMIVCGDQRDARVLVGVLAGLDAKTTDMRPVNGEMDIERARAWARQVPRG